MTGWITGIEGTPAGESAALVLTLFAAVLHAVFGALQKGRHDPWMSRGAIDACYALMAAPFAFLVVPWPDPSLIPLLAGIMLIHLGYKILQALTYSFGAYTVVYPVQRGTGPVFAMVGATIIFGESYSPVQWFGLAMLSGGILALGIYNLRKVTAQRETLPLALGFAVATGLFVALYTTVDAYGIRATPDPFTFLAWFFFLDGLTLPFYALWRRSRMAERPDWGPLMARGVTGALVAFGSFGAVMLATRVGKVGEAAALRETSVIFSALIGWLMLGERTGPARVALMALIALGAVVVEAG